MKPRPNILLIVSDDHATPTISCYGSQMNQTPNIDRIGNQGMRFNNAFCTNAICTPARASILTGKYSHRNNVYTLGDTIDQTEQPTLPQYLHRGGYQTAVVGKWHLGLREKSKPDGFDYWSVFAGQGRHLNPEMVEMDTPRSFDGYSADVIADQSLNWLRSRQKERPFFLMSTFKATHDPFIPNPKDLDLYTTDVPEPLTLFDDYQNRAAAAEMSTQRVSIMEQKHHLPESTPEELSGETRTRWNYQCFLKNYLRCAHAIDENVGRLLNYLDQAELVHNTIVIYTSDHGFFLGDHGWYDKRFMYEASIRVPLLVRYPAEIPAHGVSEKIALNVDLAPTLLDYADLPISENIQGESLCSLLDGSECQHWRTSMYYRYWMHLAHFNVPAHYGIRTERHKLIHYYGQSLGATGAIDQPTPTEWELFDLETDPQEMNNLYSDPNCAKTVNQLKDKLNHLRSQLGDEV